MKTQHYKILTMSSFAIFLFTVFSYQSLILLLLTGYFGYKFILKTFNSLSQKELMQLMPKKWKEQIQEKSFAEYVSNLDIVKTTPMLSYFVPLLNSKSGQKSSIQFPNKTKTMSAITATSDGKQVETQFNKTSLKMMRQPSGNEINLCRKIYQKQNNSTKVQDRIINAFGSQRKEILFKQQPASLTTCESNYKNVAQKKTNGGAGKASISIKRKFAEESSSIDENLGSKDKSQGLKRLHRSNSENKLALRNYQSNVTVEHKDLSNKGSLQPSTHHQHPLKTIEQYIQALIWMMKRLLGLRKMTSRIKRASTLKITMIASFFWIAIVLQFKIDSKNRRLLFKSFRLLLGILSVFVALGATSMIVFKIHKSLTYKEQPKRHNSLFFGKK